jgi:hypothetical protein
MEAVFTPAIFRAGKQYTAVQRNHHGQIAALLARSGSPAGRQPALDMNGKPQSFRTDTLAKGAIGTESE